MSDPALHIEAETNTAVSHPHTVTRVTRTGESVTFAREIANETPVAIEFDGTAYAVMMATPADLEDFAVGFALSERIVHHAAEIARIDIRYGERGIAMDLRLEREHSARLAERRRALAGQSGCGICGITTIEEALPELTPITSAASLRSNALFTALDALTERQTLSTASFLEPPSSP